MADERREVSYPSPPYADPLTILAPHSTVDEIPVPVQSRTGLGKFLSLFLFSIFLLYMICQIILGGFNCSLPDSNLGWIRASLFLNIPFVLCLCIYFIRNFQRKTMPSLTHFGATVAVYTSFFFIYLVYLGIYFEVNQLMEIRKVLGNTTMIELLPCSTSYYENIFRLKISQYVLIIFCLFVFCFPYVNIGSKDRRDFLRERIDRLISLIVNQWRYILGILCERHQGEIVIHRY